MKLFKREHNPQQIVEVNQQKNKRIILKASSNIKKGTIRSELNHLGDSTQTRVCIQRSCGGIGDILMATPLLEAIKTDFPQSHLTFAIDTKSAGDTYYSLVKNNPFIDEIISISTVKRDNYHLFKDISSVCLAYENSGQPWINRIDIFAGACGFNLKNHLPYYKVEQEEDRWAQQFLSERTKIKNPKYIMLHTASFDVKRTWPIHKYTELISYLNSKKDDLVYLINDFQHMNPYWDKVKNVIEVSNFRIRELAALTKQCDLFIGPDSGPMHIAGSLGIKGIGLFGSIPPQARINHYPTFEALEQTNLACLHCHYKNCVFNVRCMKDLSAERVGIKALEKISN